jgi:demethylmenaquinone methyltransferase / 2-methoxy-6-polyprenyl-1,4-benzoquinol methylase
VALEVFQGLGDRYDLLAEVLSFAQNRRWRRTMVDRVVAARPGRVLDVATGTAGVAIQLAQRTQAQVVGVDLTPGMLTRGRANLERHGIGPRVQLTAGRAERLPFADGEFDALTFTYLLRYVDDPAATIAELARVVRAGGVIAALDFGVPPSPVWRAAWWLYTRAVLPVAGGLTGGREWYHVGRFLGPGISNHERRYPLSWTVGAWELAGITGVTVRRMSLGGGVVMWGTRR